MPASNLDFSIGADTSRARADLKLLNEQMKIVGQQMRAALKAGDTAGARTLADTFGVMQTRAAGLNRELKGTEVALNGVSRSAGLTQRSFRSLEGAILGIGKSLGGARAGLIGFAAVTGIEKLLGTLDEVDKRMRDIRDASRETGQKPLVTQAAQEIAGKAGEKPEDAAKILAGVSEAFAKAQVAGQGAADAARQVNASFQQGVQVFRGSQPLVLDLAHAYETLGIHMERYRGNAAGQQQATLDIAKAFLQMQRSLNPAQLNELSKALFKGLPADAAIAILPGLIKNLQAQIDELSKSERGVTDPRIEELKALDAALNKLGTRWEELAARIGNATRASRTDITNYLSSMLKSVDDTVAQLGNIFKKSFWFDQGKEPFGPLKKALESIGQVPPETVNVFSASMDGGGVAGPQVFRGPGPGTYVGYGPPPGGLGSGHGIPGQAYGESAGDPGSRLQSDTPGLSNYQAPPPKVVYPSMMSSHPAVQSAAEASADAAYAARTAAEASATAVNAWINPGYSAYAGGGMVRGPGTATSDSIVARLSAGEFVMRAAAVSRLGAGFLSRLNGFADGGMAMPSRGIPSFAGGGLVGAGGGGAVVNLVFPGGTFGLQADNETVGALTREARRAGMLTGGRRAGLLT